jgi:hypothetical protein
MRALAALVVLVGAGLVAGTAAADPVPLPPVPTVTVPTLPAPTPVPLPAVPSVPLPAVSTTSVEPTTSSLPQASSVANSGSVVVGGGSGGSSSGGSSSGYSGGGSPSGGASSGDAPSGGSSSPSAPRVEHFHSSRAWIGTTGSKKRRTTTFTFVLPHAARVVFTVNKVSPVCVGIGRFSVAGHAGLNRVRFSGRVHGQQLDPGTYRISARTAAGRLVRRITLVVVSGSAPTRPELQSLRAANVCSATARRAAAAVRGATSVGGSPLPTQPLPRPITQSAKSASGIVPAHGPNLHSGVLASSADKTARAIRPLLVALLGLAIVLLAVAALPGAAVAEPRVHDALARHRLEIAGLGAAALVAVALAFLLD